MKYEKLSNLYKIASGGTPSRKVSEYYLDGDIPWVKTGDLKQKHLKNVTEFITESGLNNSSAKLFPKDTVLIAMYGATIGNCSILSIDAATNQACAAFIPNEEILPDYLYYFFLSIKDELISKGVGGAQPNISISILKDIEIPKYPINVQKKIVEILNRNRDIIEKRKAQIVALSDLTQSVFLKMLSANNKVIKKIKLKDLILDTKNGISRRGSDTNGEIVLRLREIKSNSIAYSEGINRISLNEKEKNNYQLIQDDIVLVRVNGNPDYVGRCAVFNEIDEKVFFNDHIIRIRISEDVNPLYLTYFLNSQYGKKEIRKYIKTSAGQYTISREGIEKITIMLPPIDSQRKFANMFTAIIKGENVLKQGLINYEEIFNSLMQRAFKGELFND